MEFEITRTRPSLFGEIGKFTCRLQDVCLLYETCYTAINQQCGNHLTDRVNCNYMTRFNIIVQTKARCQILLPELLCDHMLFGLESVTNDN